MGNTYLFISAVDERIVKHLVRLLTSKNGQFKSSLLNLFITVSVYSLTESILSLAVYSSRLRHKFRAVSDYGLESLYIVKL